MSDLQSADGGDFVAIDIVDNFYQACSFIPMSFALVTTVHEGGETGIGPHALLAPFGITPPYSMLLISRHNSGTAVNIRRHGKCALNYVPFDRDAFTGIANMGYPGMSLEDKAKANPYTMIDSPTPEKAADPECPQLIAEAFQVFECTWHDRVGLHQMSDDKGQAYDSHFILNIDKILLREEYAGAVEKGEVYPDMPVFCGFRPATGFWFAETNPPFSVPLPKVEGLEHQHVFYVANRIHTDTRFTEDACKALTGIPRPFLQDALKGIVERAQQDGVALIDAAYLEKIRP
ncbi:MAG: hypothetical protein KJO76_01820 [Gammaproteobacteria bacterium]|nr:hypothetical protein [Gammaproteobacteria bacterium]MBT8445192.1 hypothetical protein [Gammaproteobacteria bacterium]NND37170.1 hypothetical protein [Gammaproteobacteria bacterium]